MTSVSAGFHAKDGWYFRRTSDGSVTIQAPDSLGPGASQVIALDAGTWASAVASVCASGETSQTWNTALEQHRN